jgi:hypothetical protein
MVLSLDDQLSEEQIDRVRAIDGILAVRLAQL